MDTNLILMIILLFVAGIIFYAFYLLRIKEKIEKIHQEFTYLLVHELRSPIDGIKKISETLSNKRIEISTLDREEYVNLIFRNASQMLELVNDILNVAKIEAGKFSIHRQSNNIRKIIEDRVHFYSAISKYEKININCSFDDNLPKDCICDREGIAHVLSNLLSNAIKYTNSGGKVNVFVFKHTKGFKAEEEAKRSGYDSVINLLISGSENLDDSIFVVVADNGIGMPEEEQINIFEKYKQLSNHNSLSKNTTGTGLGLYLARCIVESHQGAIGVFSEAGTGSTFYFSLPITNE